jgi:hypothetical protein
MGYKGNSASEEMVKLSETVRNIYNNSIHEDKMAVSYATATKNPQFSFLSVFAVT